MAYTFEALVTIEVDDDDWMNAAEYAEEFFTVGLEQLAYSSDPDDDKYTVKGVRINWGASKEV